MEIKAIVSRMRGDPFLICIPLLSAALILKFFLPLFLYDVPLGYDPGIYRYLFLKYAEALGTLSLPELSPWAQEYPSGMFLLFSPLTFVGISADSLLGWVWNTVPIVLLGVLSWATAKRSGRAVGVSVLLIGLLSVAYYDGFFAMYYKVFVSLIFLVLTYHFLEKLSPWFLLTALMTVLIHQQSALILTVTIAVWWGLALRGRCSEKRFRRMTIALVAVGVAGIAWYLPNWERAIWSPLKSIFLLRGDDAPAGTFPELSFYLRTQAALIAFGAMGFIRSFRKDRGSPWQISVVVCLLFIAFRLVFYRRFFLHLDFFLMPFAAEALVWLYGKAKKPQKILLMLLLVSQAYLSYKILEIRKPRFSAQQLSQIVSLRTVLPEHASIIAMENVSGTWLRGWLPKQQVGAPGLFDYPGWTYEQWEQFIDGTAADRKQLLSELRGPVYFLLTEPFVRYYGDRASPVLNDPCLQSLSIAPVLLSVCSAE